LSVWFGLWSTPRFGSRPLVSLHCLHWLVHARQQIGLTYSGWFTYRYLLQEETREELKVIIEDLIGKAR